MTDLFKEIIPSITRTKKDYSGEADFDKVYNPFIVNRCLSYYLDVLPFVAEINQRYNLDKSAQYRFLLNSVRSRHRTFHKMERLHEDERLESVKEFFGFSNAKAKEALRVLSEEQIHEITIRTQKGGVKNNGSRTSGAN